MPTHLEHKMQFLDQCIQNSVLRVYIKCRGKQFVCWISCMCTHTPMHIHTHVCDFGFVITLHSFYYLLLPLLPPMIQPQLPLL